MIYHVTNENNLVAVLDDTFPIDCFLSYYERTGYSITPKEGS